MPHFLKSCLGVCAVLVIWLVSPVEAQQQTTKHCDICVYGGTSAGVIAAVQAKTMVRQVVLVSPDKHLGGMTSGGLGFTDIGDPKTVGGLTREFFHRVWSWYQAPMAWTLESRNQFGSAGQGAAAFDDKLEIGTVFEPHVAEAIYNQMILENGVIVVHGRLDQRDAGPTSKNGVIKIGKHITAIRLEDGQTISADVFIDAGYEGDLMAKAGVSFTVGREANSQYGETADGVELEKGGNRIPSGISPYVKPGDPSSGLLPRVNSDPGGPNGTGDKKIQAYCYRLCLTNLPANRVQIDKPPGYREKDYELLFRCIAAGQERHFLKLSPIPNHKTDTNNDSGISSDAIGMNYDYPAADYATRDKIAQAHELWQRGLIWTLQNDPRVPDAVRASYAKWGLAKDEFTDTNNWPSELYIREARRMVNDHVMTEPIILGRKVEEPVAIGSYKMDSHNTQYCVGPKGFIETEGDVQKSPKGPYQIDYRNMIPRESECDNLIVPVCLAASHIAYGSIRMESVFMMLGQSAATAAALAQQHGTSVQQVPYDALKSRLDTEGQILEVQPK
jgi:hypothetical protein